MKRALFGLILGILLFGIGFAAAEDIDCSSNADCGEATTSFTFCKNETHVCTTTTTPTCHNASTNASSCENIKEDTCWICENKCVNKACLVEDETNEDDTEEKENETETDENESGVKAGNEIKVISKTRVRGNVTFTPWQKRNESECLEGCSCQGAVMSCETENGRVITIQAGKSGNIIVITIDGTEVETELEIETENDSQVQERNRTRIKAKLKDGIKKEIKVMPDAASEKALERLRLKVCSSDNNCTIQLKEVGIGTNKQLAYELQAERHMKLLAIFKAKALVKAQIDAETGEIITVKKPWWAFLATEPEE